MARLARVAFRDDLGAPEPVPGRMTANSFAAITRWKVTAAVHLALEIPATALRQSSPPW